MRKALILTVLAIGPAVAACSSNQTTLISTGSLPNLLNPASTSAKPAAEEKKATVAAKPGGYVKPVTTAKATRMFVWAGFKEKDCSPVEATMTLAAAPTKGDVSFRANETITVQQSASGKCVGQRIAGTAIYYTPKAGQAGPDQFTVAAATPNGGSATRSFKVEIVEAAATPDEPETGNGSP